MNGAVIGGPSDFNENVAVIERVVTMPASTATLAVKLQRPGPLPDHQGPIVEVRGATSTELPVQVGVNGEPATLAGGQFTALTPLLEARARFMSSRAMRPAARQRPTRPASSTPSRL